VAGPVALGAGRRTRGTGPVDALEPANRAVLGTLPAELDSRNRDWAAYHRATVTFHLRNAAAWANRAPGADLALQVDPGFVPGPVAHAS
jgi:CO dehydrogenase maturation factor